MGRLGEGGRGRGGGLAQEEEAQAETAAEESPYAPSLSTQIGTKRSKRYRHNYSPPRIDDDGHTRPALDAGGVEHERAAQALAVILEERLETADAHAVVGGRR